MSAPAGAVIAVCEPGGDAAGTLATAGRLAEANGAPLIALSVVEPPSELAALAAAVGLSEAHAVDRLIAEAREELETATQRFDGPTPSM
ncbi:MAG: universal stress protein [Pseudomonadota bacterium]